MQDKRPDYGQSGQHASQEGREQRSEAPGQQDEDAGQQSSDPSRTGVIVGGGNEPEGGSPTLDVLKGDTPEEGDTPDEDGDE
jgi:hypothetical protein